MENTKICTCCGEEKPRDEFYKTGGKCKKCYLALRKQRYDPEVKKHYYSDHKDHILTQRSSRYRENKAVINAKAKQRRDADPNHKLRSRGYRMKHRYGLTVAELDAMIASQDGKCLICGQAKRLCVDHFHGDGKIRGLLCNECNGVIGFFRESPELLRSAIEYLQKYKERSRP